MEHFSMMINQKVSWQLHTSGDGHWSNSSQLVKVVRVELAYQNDEGDFGELRAYFDTMSWDCNKHGLIYTDSKWLNEFRAMMRTLGFTSRACDDISYSEQGMQGNDYVSMDVCDQFMLEAEPMYRFIINRQMVNSELA
jgi:hypothetical protein